MIKRAPARKPLEKPDYGKRGPKTPIVSDSSGDVVDRVLDLLAKFGLLTGG